MEVSRTNQGSNLSKALLLLLLLLLLPLLWAFYLYYRRRYHLQDAKTVALHDIAGMSNLGEIIPEEGDVVEWGQNVNSLQFAFAGDDASDYGARMNADNGMQSKRRKGDLFVI